MTRKTEREIVAERHELSARIAELRSARGRALAAGDAIDETSGEEIARLQARLDDLEDAIESARAADEEQARVEKLRRRIDRRDELVDTLERTEAQRIAATGRAEKALYDFGNALSQALAAADASAVAVRNLMTNVAPSHTSSPGEPPYDLVSPNREQIVAAWMAAILRRCLATHLDQAQRLGQISLFGQAGDPDAAVQSWPGQTADAVRRFMEPVLYTVRKEDEADRAAMAPREPAKYRPAKPAAA